MTKLENHLVIFAHARSGSTSLVRSLNLHPDLTLAEEPFHPKYGVWHPDERSYIDTIVDSPSLDLALEEIFSKYNGIKVLDYQLPNDLYCRLLQRDCKVICLRRRNILKTIVSNLVAAQTSIWHISDLNSATEQQYKTLQPLDLNDIENRISYHNELQAIYRPIISQKPAPLRMFVDYEDLYTDSLSRNRDALRKIFEFVGLLMPESAEIDLFLDPNRSRILASEIYDLIPNATEIENLFGNKNTGWLFKEEGTTRGQ